MQDFLHPQSLIGGLALKQETQVGHNNNLDGSGKLSQPAHSERSCFGVNGNKQYLTSPKHDALTSFARGMRCKRIALARFPQRVGCREFLARKMRPPQSALSQHYSQHSVNTTVNTTVNTAKTLQITAFRGIYTFLGIK